MSWMGKLYGEVLHGFGNFHLRENGMCQWLAVINSSVASLSNGEYEICSLPAMDMIFLTDAILPSLFLDYAFSSRKFGGNAQSITRKWWIHHTSFFWDYNTKNMDYLKLPTRAPKYRSARSHEEFLCQLKEYVPSRLDSLLSQITSQFSQLSWT